MSTSKEEKSEISTSSSKAIDDITLHYLTCKDKEELAIHLDVDSKWKFVAEEIGMKPKKILWIPCRQNPRGSETLGFLEDLESSEVTLKKFIEAVNASSCQVLPVINLLNKRYPEIKEKYHQEMEKKYHQEQLFPQAKNNFKPDTVKCGKFPKCASKSHVFIVHFDQDFKRMISVANCLMDNDFTVSIYKQEKFISLEKENLMKIQKLFNEVDWTILLVSPTFLDIINKMSNLDMDDPNIISLYITELVKGAQSKMNTKLNNSLVVLLDGAKTENFPNWMRNLKAFQWPDNYQSLLFYITSTEELLWKLKIKQNQKMYLGKARHHH